MTISLKHTTQAVGTDAGNGEIRKTQWNQEHTLTSASGVVLGRATAGTGNVEELTSFAGVGVFDKARAYLATAQSSTASYVAAKINLDTVSYDTNGIWNSTNKRFIPKKAGYYQCNMRARTDTTGGLGLIVALNGSAIQAVGADVPTTQAAGGSVMIYCNGSTDYLELWSAASTARAYTTGSYDTYMEVLGPF